MGKRKRKEASKPWCFYCDQEFMNEKVLVDHQKARHFKCYHCGKKLPSSAGLAAHVLQVHKETVTKVPNAKEGRDSIEFGVIGMENIPEEFLDEEERQSKRQKEDSNRPLLPPPLIPGMPAIPVVGIPSVFPGFPGYPPLPPSSMPPLPPPMPPPHMLPHPYPVPMPGYPPMPYYPPPYMPRGVPPYSASPPPPQGQCAIGAAATSATPGES
eukprot:GGOE01010121.1.p1 GENE.GGOE01010121.1~~GGOE01010121.1.p1  ORF type:complete len:212 (+),score=1.80 GGOE01010121.1:111-746(+)